MSIKQVAQSYQNYFENPWMKLLIDKTMENPRGNVESAAQAIKGQPAQRVSYWEKIAHRFKIFFSASYSEKFVAAVFKINNFTNQMFHSFDRLEAKGRELIPLKQQLFIANQSLRPQRQALANQQALCKAQSGIINLFRGFVDGRFKAQCQQEKARLAELEHAVNHAPEIEALTPLIDRTIDNFKFWQNAVKGALKKIEDLGLTLANYNSARLSYLNNLASIDPNSIPIPNPIEQEADAPAAPGGPPGSH